MSLKIKNIFLVLCMIILCVVCCSCDLNTNNEHVVDIEIFKHFDLSEEKAYWTGDVDDLDNEYINDRWVVVYLKRTKTYPELDLSVFGLDNAIGMRYSGGVTPPDYIKNPDEWRQIIEIELLPLGKEKLLETIRKIEKLEFVHYVGPAYEYSVC